MNILILGSGGREHAFAKKIKSSKLAKNLFIAPGNSGTKKTGTNLNINYNDFSSIKKAVLQHRINMVVVGPEEPLVNGIHDYFLGDLALKDVNDAIQIDPNSTYAYNWLGHISMIIEDYDKALFSFNKTIEIDQICTKLSWIILFCIKSPN